ncbi:hypothetical protein HMPREF9296_1935 [Prevotella disiens FB035-09AN]|uniref:Uncharacterized protein n=1 Tax=Prevotella disiens FB035-09AN TaxID=866771 RepID=E1KMN1_9BACT|nr:hypothetical protein HMPREF9296_1935 [Prevotella disiens FB035-09AN]
MEVAVCRPCACHRPCLRSLRRTVVATEALTIHVVVVVLTVIRLVKRLVIFLDSLQLLAIFFLVVHRQAVSLIACIRYSSWVCLLCSPIYAAFLILLQILSYSLIVYGYQLYNVVLSSLLLTAFNTHIRVMMNTLIRVLPITLIGVGHTLVWVSSNNLYMVYHRLIVLMLYILLFITAATRHMCSTFVTLFILTAPD